MISSSLSTTKKKGKEGNLGLSLSKSLCIKEETADEKEDTWRFRVYEVEWDVVALLTSSQSFGN